MIRLIISIFFLALVNNCSNIKDSQLNLKNSFYKKNNTQNTSILNKSNDELFNMNFDEFNIFLNNYANKSKYPEFKNEK